MDYDFIELNDDGERLHVMVQQLANGDWRAVIYDDDENELDRTLFSKRPTKQDIQETVGMW